jgi:cholesterol transport system auxiliary component
LSVRLRRIGWTALAALLLAGCADPPLKLYTLGEPSVSGNARPLTRGAAVIEVNRLILPDDLDSEDILQRNGNVVERSATGRWVSRLSLLATDRVTSRLAMRDPDALVTDGWPAESPDYRVMIHVARLDVASNGLALMVADWQISARDPRKPPIRGRAQIRLSGPTATDADIVRLETSLFDRLADAIAVPAASPPRSQ